MTAESISSWSGSSSRMQGLRVALVEANSTRLVDVGATHRVFATVVPFANLYLLRRRCWLFSVFRPRKRAHLVESASCGFAEGKCSSLRGQPYPSEAAVGQ